MSLGLSMLSNLLKGLLMALFLVWPTEASAADQGQFTFLDKGERAPFRATCFDDFAIGKVVTWKEFLGKEFEIKHELETEKLNRERAEKARKMREEKRKVTAAEFEAYQQFRDSRVTEKITSLEKEAENWMSLNKQERDEAIDNAFREGNRTQWDQSMIDLERANSNRATRVVTNTSLRTGYPKWEQGQQ